MRTLPYYTPFYPTPYWRDPLNYSPPPADGRPQACITPRQLKLRNILRRLWDDHTALTKMVIVSIATGSPDEEAVTKRLLRNGPDMAAALKPIYGEAIANKVGDLIKEHLVLAAQLVKAAKAGDANAAAKVEKQWYRNADDIAAFFASINPYWSKAQWMSMLHEHLRLVKSQAVLRLSGDYAAEVALYDKYVNQALEMADMMSEGIIKQVPAAFA